MILDRINGRDACEVWGMFPFWISEIFQKTSDVCHLMQSNKFYSPKILRNIYLDTLYLTYCIAGWRLQTAKDQGKSGRMPCTPATLASLWPVVQFLQRGPCMWWPTGGIWGLDVKDRALSSSLMEVRGEEPSSSATDQEQRCHQKKRLITKQRPKQKFNFVSNSFLASNFPFLLFSLSII